MSGRRHFIVLGLYTLLVSRYGLRARLAVAAPAENASHVNDSSQTPRTAQRSVLVVGDSLSAEYGLAQGSGWVEHIAQLLHEHDTGYQIYNRSISGDTTSGGVTRLPADLDQLKPDIVLIELGSNDALRGLPLDMVRKNLAEMIRLCQEAGAHVMLLGMQIPPNYGRRYAEQFAALFPDLANTYKTALVPFLLDGFATQANMFLDDGIHPSASAQPLIAQTVWEQLAPLVVDKG